MGMTGFLLTILLHFKDFPVKIKNLSITVLRIKPAGILKLIFFSYLSGLKKDKISWQNSKQTIV